MEHGEGPSQGKYTRQKPLRLCRTWPGAQDHFFRNAIQRLDGVLCWSQAKGALQQRDVRSVSPGPGRLWQGWTQLKSLSSEIFTMQRLRVGDKNLIPLCDSLLAFLPCV